MTKKVYRDCSLSKLEFVDLLGSLWGECAIFLSLHTLFWPHGVFYTTYLTTFSFIDNFFFDNYFLSLTIRPLFTY